MFVYVYPYVSRSIDVLKSSVEGESSVEEDRMLEGKKEEYE